MEYFNVSTGNDNRKRNAGIFCERIFINNEENRDFVFHNMEVMNRFFQQKNTHINILCQLQILAPSLIITGN